MVKNIYNDVKFIRSYKSAYLGKLVSIDGLVRKMTGIIPVIKTATFECRGCMRLHEVTQRKTDQITEPSLCSDCGGRNFHLLEDESEFKDLQIITLQEPHEQLGGSSQPRPLRIYAEHDLVDTITPGELVRITGILTSIIKKRADHREMYIKANHIETLAKEFEEIKITPEDKKEILELSQHPDLYNKIIRSVAPLIEGHERFKEAVMLQLFGGSSVDIDNADVHLRSNIHILIVGDPGIGKSQILKYISKIAPGGIYASGKGTTGVGLTAAVVSDEIGGWTLEAGALVLGDKGFVCVDEMDKMREEDRSSMHEALEQETITINKAGINATLNARCSVLGAANPKFGRFNHYKTIAQQLDLPPTLLSRFDLIFVVEDHPDEARDGRIAEHIAKLRSKQSINFEIEPLLLKKYIAYARQNYNPILPDENVKLIKEYYIKMRGMNGSEEDAPLAITPRQLEGLIRLAGASAKIHLRDTITVEDIENVIDLQNECMKQVGYDSVTGKIDIDMVEGRTSAHERSMIATANEIIENLEDDWGRRPSDSIIIDVFIERLSISETEAKTLYRQIKKGTAQ